MTDEQKLDYNSEKFEGGEKDDKNNNKSEEERPSQPPRQLLNEDPIQT